MKKYILFIILVAIILVLALVGIHYTTNTPVKDSSNALSSQEVEEKTEVLEANEVERDEIQNEPETTKSTLNEVEIVDRVNCDNDVACFLAAVSENQEAYYWGEGVDEVFPRIQHWTSQNWTFIPQTNDSYELILTSHNLDLTITDGWFKPYAESSDAPPDIASIVDELNNAEFPSEAELALLDDETRIALEQIIASGKSPSDLAWEQAEFATSNSINSTIMSTRSKTSTCQSSDKNSLVTELNSLGEAPVLLAASMPFLSCEVNYEF